MSHRLSKHESIRTRLGISQEHFAGYLRISRTVLAMYESGQRMLPSASGLKHAQLQLLHMQQKKEVKAVTQPDQKQEEETIAALKDTIEFYRIKAHRANKKLVASKKLFESHTALLRLMTAVLEDPKISEYDKTFADMFVAIAAQTLRLHGQHEQTMMQFKLDGYNREIHEATKLLATMQ